MEDLAQLASARTHRLIRTSDLTANGSSSRQLHAAVRDGVLVRIYQGTYVKATHWAELTPDDRYRYLVHAVLLASQRPRTLSHHSAAVMHGLPIVSSWPDRVHLLTPHATGGSSRPAVRSHVHPEDPHTIVKAGVRLTGLVRTVVDLACACSFVDGVTTVDAALRRGLDKASLREELDRLSPRRGFRRAHRAIEFGDPRSGSVGESLCRARMHELGFATPDLQVEFATVRGTFPVDFYWRSANLIVEFDGKGKYFDESMTGGRSPGEVVWREKLREDAIRQASGARFIRWTWVDVIDRCRFASVLGKAGIPRADHATRR